MLAQIVMDPDSVQLSSREEILLELMVHAYLTGPCSSVQIEERILKSSELTDIFLGDPPSPREIRYLRRHKRGLLIRRLAAMINRQSSLFSSFLPAVEATAIVDLAILFDCIDNE